MAGMTMICLVDLYKIPRSGSVPNLIFTKIGLRQTSDYGKK